MFSHNICEELHSALLLNFLAFSSCFILYNRYRFPGQWLYFICCHRRQHGECTAALITTALVVVDDWSPVCCLNGLGYTGFQVYEEALWHSKKNNAAIIPTLPLFQDVSRILEICVLVFLSSVIMLRKN